MEKTYEIRRGRTEIDVPHENGTLTFVSPIKGPDTYANVQKAINSDGLIAPTMSKTASLAYTANKNPEEPEFKQVLDRLDNNWLWGFNGILYVPNEGAYIQDNPNIKNNKVALNKSELIKRLESNDKSVRFVPFGFKTGEQTALQLAKNEFIIGLAGEEGAEKLAKLSERYKFNPKVWSFENVDNEIARVPTLCGYYDGLSVYGNYYGSGSYGYALGVLTSAEGAKSAKKQNHKLINPKSYFLES